MQLQLCVTAIGGLSLAGDPSDALRLDYELHDHLGDSAVLDVSFRLKTGATTALPENTIMALVWRDAVTDDVIYQIDGVLGGLGSNPDDTALLVNRMEAMEAFKFVELFVYSADFQDAIEGSDGYNLPNSRGKNKISIDLPDDQPDSFNADTVIDLLVLMEPRPAYIVLPQVEDLTLLDACLVAGKKLNIPLKAELDPTLTLDQATSLAESLDVDSHLCELIWSAVLSRPRDAVSLRGRKKPRRAIGAIMGDYLLRNARIDQKGIPPIHTPVAGFDFPMGFKAMEMRGDVLFNEGAVENLAVAKINTVRRIVYDQGVRFVLSDVLTQKKSADSALRLVNAAEIISYTTNRCIDILRRHMLKRQKAFLTDASRDINEFLSACYSAGLLVVGEDLGGKAFDFSLTPDAVKPFERVRLKLNRCPEGATRGVLFDDDVVSK